MGSLLTIEESAHILRLGRTSVYELIRRKSLPSVRIGGARRIVAADLDRFIEALAEKGEIPGDG